MKCLPQSCSLSFLAMAIKADVNIPDRANGDTLLHYAAVGQGNASLYIKYLCDKMGMSVFVKKFYHDKFTVRIFAIPSLS